MTDKTAARLIRERTAAESPLAEALAAMEMRTTTTGATREHQHS